MNRASRTAVWLLVGVALAAVLLTLAGIGCRLLIIHLINSVKP